MTKPIRLKKSTPVKLQPARSEAAPIPAPPPRDVIVQVRMTRMEVDRIKRDAVALGQSVSTHIQKIVQRAKLDDDLTPVVKKLVHAAAKTTQKFRESGAH